MESEYIGVFLASAEHRGAHHQHLPPGMGGVSAGMKSEYIGVMLASAEHRGAHHQHLPPGLGGAPGFKQGSSFRTIPKR